LPKNNFQIFSKKQTLPERALPQKQKNLEKCSLALCQACVEGAIVVVFTKKIASRNMALPRLQFLWHIVLSVVICTTFDVVLVVNACGGGSASAAGSFYDFLECPIEKGPRMDDPAIAFVSDQGSPRTALAIKRRNFGFLDSIHTIQVLKMRAPHLYFSFWVTHIVLLVSVLWTGRGFHRNHCRRLPRP
jgi:hypothetical protein